MGSRDVAIWPVGLGGVGGYAGEDIIGLAPIERE